MNDFMPALTEQMLILATLMLIGFAEHRFRIVSDELADGLSALITKLILPFMLITLIGSISRAEVTRALRVFIAVIIFYSASVFAAKFLSRYNRIPEPQKSMHALLQCYGNTGYIAIPLMTSLFPDTAGVFAAASIPVDAFFYWVIAPALAKNGAVSFKRLVSPITISTLAGVIIMLLDVDLSGSIIWNTMTNVGGTCKYFASIYIGMCISRIGFKKLKPNLSSLTAAPIKLVVFPLLAYIALGKTGLLQGDALTMMILFSAAPAGMSLPIIADISEVDSAEYASVGVAVSTLLCLVTIPLVMWIVQLF